MSAPHPARAKRCGRASSTRNIAGVSDKEFDQKLSAALERLEPARPSYKAMLHNMAQARLKRWAHRKD